MLGGVTTKEGIITEVGSGSKTQGRDTQVDG